MNPSIRWREYNDDGQERTGGTGPELRTFWNFNRTSTVVLALVGPCA